MGAAFATLVMLLTASAVEASPLARVRFVEAIPGTGPARVEVVSATTGVRTSAGGESTFGQVTPYAATSSGKVRLQLVARGAHASTSAVLRDGASYTVVAASAGRHPELRLYRDAGAVGGRATLRVIHAAPELGSPEITLDGRPIAQRLGFGSSTGYIGVTPGNDQLAVMTANGGRTVATGTVSLAAGTATTAIVVGTAGQPVRVTSAQDATVTSGGAPETGLGGLASGGGPRWILILAAMLAGGTLAGVLQVSLRRRGQR